MMRFRGVPVREIHGLPYSVHQIGDGQWQVVIQNCERYPSGYSFAPVYGNYREAMDALESWPEGDVMQRGYDSYDYAGDDTGSAYLARWED